MIKTIYESLTAELEGSRFSITCGVKVHHYHRFSSISLAFIDDLAIGLAGFRIYYDTGNVLIKWNREN